MGLYTYLKNGYSNLPDLFDVNLQDYISVWRDGNPFRAKIDDITVGYQNRVVVKNLSDFGTVSNNRVRPDSSKLYMLDGFIDMENVSIEVPEGGLSIAGLNGGRDVMGLISDADNHTFFVSPVGGYSGDVVMESMTVNGTGANSKCFDLDNAGNSNAIDITGVNFGLFGSTMSCGDLTEYRQLLSLKHNSETVESFQKIKGLYAETEALQKLRAIESVFRTKNRKKTYRWCFAKDVLT